HDRPISGAVVGEQLLHADTVALEEGDGAPQKANDRAGLLVGEDLGIGQAGAVVDSDMRVLPADLETPHPGRVGSSARVASLPVDAVAGAALDASELLDVDVD